MDIYELIDTLQSEIENASQVPLVNKIMLEKDRILDLIEDLRNAFPKEIAEARQIASKQEKIIEDAQNKAQTIIEKSKERQKQLINSNTVTQEAYKEAERIIKDARIEANMFRAKSIDYTYAMFQDTEENLKTILKRIEDNKEELKENRKNIQLPKTKSKNN